LNFIILLKQLLKIKKIKKKKKTIEEADKVIDYFKDKLKLMKKNFNNKWDTQKQLYCVLKIYLNYGVLRPSELIDMKITTTDEGNEKINYINYETNMMVINKHKNDRNGPKRIEIKDRYLMEQLHQRINKYLICNSKHEPYNDSSAFTKLFSKTFNNYTPYDL